MPKIVDHDAVRAELADAAMRLLEREGLSAVSVRRVAEEAQVTPGYLRHYYPTQVALEQTLAIRTAMNTRDRLMAIITDGRAGTQRAREALLELLPLDRQRRLEAQVAFRFIVNAGDVPDYAGDLGLLASGLRSITRFAIMEYSDREHDWDFMEPLSDPELEGRAEMLAEVIDGIALYGMQVPSTPPEELIGRLDNALQRITGAEAHEQS